MNEGLLTLSTTKSHHKFLKSKDYSFVLSFDVECFLKKIKKNMLMLLKIYQCSKDCKASLENNMQRYGYRRLVMIERKM